MKKAKHYIVATVLLIAMLPSLTGCYMTSLFKSALQGNKELLGVDISKGTVVYESDSHGGFLGDGTRFVKISFSDEDCLNMIKQSPDWKPLPLTDTVTALVYGLKNVGPWALDENGNPLFPAIENGYYCFVDRYFEKNDNEDESEVLKRPSYNFTVAIYDTDTNILYYWEEDT